MNIGVIGTGHLGRIHTKLLCELQSDSMVGVYDIDSSRAEAVASEFETHFFPTLEELLQQVDAVVIANSTTAHYETLMTCLQHGVHCFVEKPITSTGDEAHHVLELAQDKKLLVQVGHVERFNPALAALREFSLDPKFVESHRLAQFKPRATDVSVIHDLMIHDIDIVLHLVNSEVESIEANGVAVLTETPDIANARIGFKNGCVANLTASRMSTKNLRKMRLFQKDHYFSVDFGKPEAEVFFLTDEHTTPDSGVPAMMLGAVDAGTTQKHIYFEKPPIKPVNAIAEEHRTFLESIQNGSPIAVTAHEGMQALSVAEEIEHKVLQQMRS